jgi:zinc protease
MHLAVPRTLVALALQALVAAPATPVTRLSVPYEMFRLPNGLSVIVHEDHSAPVVSVNCWYHVGSGRETPGRTGFAHLFEHLMFEGSKNVPEGAFDRWLEAVGGSNNGSTEQDRTNYYEDVPAKNERRQRIENQPYGKVWEALPPALFPAGHPYSWLPIGSMADLSAASYEDVVAFFRSWYGPANASLVIAGDVDAREVRSAVEKWFADVPKSEPVDPIVARPVVLREEKRIVLEDKVQLPRLYSAWVTPAGFAPGDAALDAVAAVLAGGKNSRLYKRLVYELQVAQDVAAFQSSDALASTFLVIVTARSGHGLEEIRRLVDEELAKLQAAPPSERETVRFQNRTEAAFLDRLEQVGDKADQLNDYYFRTGNPDYFEEDLARYRALAPSDVQAAAARFLGSGRVLISVVPEGKQELAVPEVAR